MRNMFSGLVIAVALAFSGTASAHEPSYEPVAGHYRFDLMHFIILNGSGTPLTDEQKERVERIFDECAAARPGYDPNRGTADFAADIDNFRRCVHSAMFDARWRDHLFWDYLLLEGTLNGRPGHTRR